MAVLIEAFSVVMANSTIASKYPGGSRAHASDCGNSTICSDGQITRVGFCHPDDLDAYVGRLLQMGLVHVENGFQVDFATLTEGFLLTPPCEWLKAGRHSSGIHVAWLSSNEPGRIAVPVNWERGTQLRYVPPSDQADYIFVKHEDGCDVYRHKVTNQLFYSGRKRTD